VSENVQGQGLLEKKGTEQMIPSGPNTFQVQFLPKSVSTNGTGNATLSYSTKKAIRLGQNITAAATNTSTGDTSEFSAPRKVVAR
jgi:hypothetical protein